jgi:hypothetical protein
MGCDLHNPTAGVREHRAAALAIVMSLAGVTGASADEGEAKQLLKAKVMMGMQ